MSAIAVTRSTNERGYGSRHQVERTAWQRKLDRGLAIQCSCDRHDCKRHDQQCPTIITAETPWDLGHNEDRTGYTGPECVPCNRGAGGRNGAKVANEKRSTIIREWI